MKRTELSKEDFKIIVDFLNSFFVNHDVKGIFVERLNNPEADPTDESTWYEFNIRKLFRGCKLTVD